MSANVSEASTETAEQRARQLVLEDIKWAYDAAMKRLDGADALAVALLTASIAAGALVVTAVKDLKLPAASQILVGAAGVFFGATAVLAATARARLLLARSRWAPETKHLGRTRRDELFGRTGVDWMPAQLPAQESALTELLETNYQQWRERADFAASIARLKAFYVTSATVTLLLAALAFGIGMLVKAAT
jgi:hypothetical protein